MRACSSSMPSFESVTSDGILPSRTAFMRSSSESFMKLSFESVEGSTLEGLVDAAGVVELAVAAGVAAFARLVCGALDEAAALAVTPEASFAAIAGGLMPAFFS